MKDKTTLAAIMAVAGMAMLCLVGCSTGGTFYAERHYHAEGHWPKNSTDEGGNWTIDFSVSHDVTNVSDYKRDKEIDVKCCLALRRPDMRPLQKHGEGPRTLCVYKDLGTCWWWEGIIKDYWGKGENKQPTYWITHWIGNVCPAADGEFDCNWIPRIHYGNLIFVSREDAERHLDAFRKMDFAYVAPDGSWFAASWLDVKYVTVEIYNIVIKPEFESRLDEPSPSDVFRRN